MYVPWPYTFGFRLVLVASVLISVTFSDLNAHIRGALSTVIAVTFLACAFCAQLIAVELADVAYRTRVVVPQMLGPRSAFWLTVGGVVTFGLTELYAVLRLWRSTVSLLGVIGPERGEQLSRVGLLAILFPEWLLQREMFKIDAAARTAGR